MRGMEVSEAWDEGYQSGLGAGEEERDNLRAENAKLREEIGRTRALCDRYGIVSLDDALAEWANEECREHHGDLLAAIDHEQELRLEAVIQLAAAQAQLAEVRAIADEHWDWKAGQTLAIRLRAALAGRPGPQLNPNASRERATVALDGTAGPPESAVQ